MEKQTAVGTSSNRRWRQRGPASAHVRGGDSAIDKDGRSHGKGKLTDTVNGDVYEGGSKDGKPNGKGKFTDLADGEVYEGDIKDGEYHGKGKHTDPVTGKAYEGDFKDGQPNGKGKVTDTVNGNVYEGDFKDGWSPGKGKYTDLTDGVVYEGDFKDGYLTGTGVVVAGTADPVHIRNWRQIFPGVSGKKQKKKRRASKDETALIKQFREMAKKMNGMELSGAKAPRLSMTRAVAATVEE